MNMIEKVARLIWQLYPENCCDTFEAEEKKSDGWYSARAKEIILAMREPSEEMIKESRSTSHLGQPLCYQAMIDAALKE